MHCYDLGSMSPINIPAHQACQARQATQRDELHQFPRIRLTPRTPDLMDPRATHKGTLPYWYITSSYSVSTEAANICIAAKLRKTE